MTRYAILIGCDEYTNFSDICFCNADVELMRSTLTQYCDYEDVNTEIIFQYKGCDETPDVIYSRLQTMIDKAEREDTVLFYFAGHGAKEGDKGYLLLSDSSARDYNTTALDLRKINEILCNPKVNGIIILDACHSGINARNTFSPLFLETINDTGCITLASCSENQESNPYPERGHGVFTYYLCDEIKRMDNGTKILIEQLKIDVCNKVSIWAEKNYKNQTPTLIGQSVGNIPFAIRNQENAENGENERQQVQEFILKNISKSLELFGENAKTILDNAVAAETSEDLNEIRVPDEHGALFFPIIKSWLFTKMRMTNVCTMEPDSEWRVFGEHFTYMATDSAGQKWIVMLNLLKKMNYASVLHAFNNLKEVSEYYDRFGKKYKYYQLVLISKGRNSELDKVISTHTKIKRIFYNKKIENVIVYLQNGSFYKVSDNTLDIVAVRKKH